MVKKVLNILLAIEILKKLDLYAYSFQKLAHSEETLIKLKYLFFDKDEKLLKKYNEIWKKVKNIMNKEFDSKPLYNEKYLKSKIKSYNGKTNTNLRNNKIRKKGSQYIYLSEC